jgi:hypothetical protein
MPEAEPDSEITKLHQEIEDEITHWLPEPGDHLFVVTLQSARLDPLGLTAPGEERSPIGRWSLYADGFLDAADRIVDGLRGCPWEDALIYPLMSLYRHHLELKLKLVIRAAPQFTDDLKLWLVNNHNLKRLWDKLGEIHPECHGWADPECTEACSLLICEFTNHDATSQACRYPEDRTGQKNLTGLRAVDPVTLKRGVHKISHYLDAILEGIHQDREWQNEIASW